jgi:DNA-binding NtrC family response regulator
MATKTRKKSTAIPHGSMQSLADYLGINRVNLWRKLKKQQSWTVEQRAKYAEWLVVNG